MPILWIIIFLVALYVLVKGADWLIRGAEKIGLAAGLSPFIVGVTIVGIGTSLPELVSSFAGAMQGVTDIVVANAVGSNIANIFLVLGVSVIIGRKLTVTKNLIDLDLPLLSTVTILFLFVAWDQQITLGESILLLLSYGSYFLYTIFHRDGEDDDEFTRQKLEKSKRPKIQATDFIYVIVGVIGLVLGARYLIEALIHLSNYFEVGTGVIAITAVAVGTSLPELLVSATAAYKGKSEVALGNILGSNVFNILVVVGLPGVFGTLPVDDRTFAIGLPIMALATFQFVISGISRRIYMWEGIIYLAIYILFISKLFGWF